LMSALLIVRKLGAQDRGKPTSFNYWGLEPSSL